jgi:hypothetical protein
MIDVSITSLHITIAMKFCAAVLLLVHAHKRSSPPYVPSRNRHEQCQELSETGRYIRQKRIPHIFLLPPSQSPWQQVLSFSNDQAMITLTGFTGEAFNSLLVKFAPIFDKYSPFVDEDGFIVKKIGNRGRPRTIRP